MTELTMIISNMGATKAHIVPLASDNQQLQKPLQITMLATTFNTTVILS